MLNRMIIAQREGDLVRSRGHLSLLKLEYETKRITSARLKRELISVRGSSRSRRPDSTDEAAITTRVQALEDRVGQLWK